MKKEKHSGDKISEQTLHEILLDIKYRLDHIEDMEADNRAFIVKLIKQFHAYKSVLTKGRLLRVVDGFKKTFPGPTWIWNNDDILEQILDNPADINNYPGYGQLEQILQMIIWSTGGSTRDLPTPLQEQTNYLQKKGEQSTRKVVSDILKILNKDLNDKVRRKS